jgi:hypothetical protein
MSMPEDKRSRETAEAGTNARELAVRRARQAVKKSLQRDLRTIHVRLGSYVQGYMASDEWSAKCGEIQREFWSSTVEDRDPRFWRLIMTLLDRDSIRSLLAEELHSEFEDAMRRFETAHADAGRNVTSALRGLGDLSAISFEVMRNVDEMNDPAVLVAESCRRETHRLLVEFDRTVKRLESSHGYLYERVARDEESPEAGLPAENLGVDEPLAGAPATSRAAGQVIDLQEKLGASEFPAGGRENDLRKGA